MTRIPIFYRMEQNAFQSASPSSAKPAFVMKSWLQKFGDRIAEHHFNPVNMREFARAHDPQYVYRVLTCQANNGFDTRDAAVARALPYTTGSLCAAARHALANGGVAVSPTSGFHHAGYDFGEGFCTFNGLMVAATQFRSPGVGLIGILDCDMHYGNGTDDIIKRLQLGGDVDNFTRRWGSKLPFDEYIKRIEGKLEYWAKRVHTSLVIYQAGADPHVNDPYGGDYTSEELRERDRVVFTRCKEYKLPVVWNLAGGYQTDQKADPADFGALIRPVLDIHDATMDECIKIFGDKS